MQHARCCCWKLHLLLVAAVLSLCLVDAVRPTKVFEHVPLASPVFIVRDALVAQCQDFHWESTDLCSGAVPYTRLGMKSALCQKHYWCTPDGGACVTTCPQGQVFDSSCQCCREFDAINSIVFYNDQHRTCNWMPRDLPPKPAEALAPVQPASTPSAASTTPGAGGRVSAGAGDPSGLQGGWQGPWRAVQEPPVPTLLVALVGAGVPNTPGVPQPQSWRGSRVPLAVYEPPSSSYPTQRAAPSAKAQALTRAILSEQRRRSRPARRVAAAAGGEQPAHSSQQQQRQQQR